MRTGDIVSGGYEATKNFYAKITPGSILVFPIVKVGSSFTITNSGSVPIKVRVFRIDQSGNAPWSDVTIAAGDSSVNSSIADGYVMAVATDGSNYPTYFNYLQGSATVSGFGTYNAYGVRAMSEFSWLPYATAGLPFGKLTLSGGYELGSNALMLPIKPISKIAVAYINGDLAASMSQMHSGFLSQFGNNVGQSISSYPASAPAYTVLSGTPTEIFTALSPSTYALPSLATIMVGAGAFWAIEQKTGSGLLFGLVFDDNVATSQINIGGVSNNLVINYPVT